MILARAEYGEWLCRPDEPEWLLTNTASTKVAGRLLGPMADGETPVLRDMLAKFIDCQWPLQFLPAN